MKSVNVVLFSLPVNRFASPSKIGNNRRMSGGHLRRAAQAAVAAALAAWALTASFGFVWDDIPTVVTNPSIRGEASFFSIVSSDFWALHEVPRASGYWRPVPTLMYRAVFAVAGSDAAWPFHLLNILLHAGVAAGAVALLSRLGASAAALMFSGLWFAVHPVHAETVSFISALPDLSAALLGLWAVHLWCCGGWMTAAGTAAFGLALLSKESALVFPAVWLFVHSGGGRKFRFGRSFYLIAVPAGLLAVVYLLFHHAVTGGIGLRPFWGGSLGAHMATVMRLFWHGLGLTIWPFPSTPVRPFEVSSTVLDPRAGVALIALAAAVLLLWKLRRHGWPISAFGLFLVFWLPVSNLFPAEGLLADRYLYLPVLGTVWFLSEAAVRSVSRPSLRLGLGAAVIAVSAVLAAFSSYPWRDDAALWRHAVTVSPRVGMAWNEHGRVLIEAGDLDGARSAFRRAVDLGPDHREARRNLILSDLKTSRYDEASRGTREYVERYPLDAAGWDLRATVLDVEGDVDGAVVAAGRALALEPSNWKYGFNLGTLLIRSGDYREALRVLDSAEARAGHRPEIALNKAAVLVFLGEWEEAVRVYERVLERWPGHQRAGAALDALLSRMPDHGGRASEDLR